jgi:hypothetical protein
MKAGNGATMQHCWTTPEGGRLPTDSYRDSLTSRSFHPAKHRSCRTPTNSPAIGASRHSPLHPINTPRRLNTHEDLNLRMPPPGGPYMHRACPPCECSRTDSGRCATASRRDFAWRQSPDGQRAAPLLARQTLLYWMGARLQQGASGPSIE